MYLRPDSVFGVFVRRLKAALDGSSFSRLSDIYDEVMRYSASLRGDRPQHTLCLNRLGVPNPCGLLKNSLSAAPVVGGGLHTAVTPAFFTGAPAVEPSPGFCSVRQEKQPHHVHHHRSRCRCRSRSRNCNRKRNRSRKGRGLLLSFPVFVSAAHPIFNEHRLSRDASTRRTRRRCHLPPPIQYQHGQLLESNRPPG